MKRIFLALLVATVTTTWVGCNVETSAPVAQTTAEVDGEFTFVKLSVPNMT